MLGTHTDTCVAIQCLVPLTPLTAILVGHPLFLFLGNTLMLLVPFLAGEQHVLNLLSWELTSTEMGNLTK